jgi:hypothetical protein
MRWYALAYYLISISGPAFVTASLLAMVIFIVTSTGAGTVPVGGDRPPPDTVVARYEPIARFVDFVPEPVLSSSPSPAPTPEPTPAPTPQPAPAPATATLRPVPSTGYVETVVRAAAAEFGVNADQLVRVAKCESGLNPLAKNPASTASGLFQFLTTTWAGNGPRLGYGPADVWDPVAASRVAAWMFAHGQSGQWVCK